MNKLNVLVVDDSAFMRKTISSLIEMSNEFTIIGKARNGIDAIEKIKVLKPDVVTLDIEMPEMNGLEALEVIMKEQPVPVLMLSNGEDATLEAYELGAVDFVVKHALLEQPSQEVIRDFWQRLKIASSAKINTELNQNLKMERERIAKESFKKVKYELQSDKELIVIGCSTGGPSALQAILPKFDEHFAIPIVVVQHMPPGFTKPLAERFNSLCALNVKEAEHNEVLQPGTIYIAPAGIQTMIQKDNDQFTIRLKVYTVIETLYKPSIDVTLFSVAPIIKNRIITVILTGMGDDGLRGCELVKGNGGIVLTEDEETCVVFGMPKVVFNAGLSNSTAPITRMYDEILDHLTT